MREIKKNGSDPESKTKIADESQSLIICESVTVFIF